MTVVDFIPRTPRPCLNDLDVSRLSRAVAAGPGEEDDVLLSLLAPGLQDVSAPDAAHGGLVRHAMGAAGPVLLVQDAAARASFGTMGIRGLARGFDPARLIHVSARNARDALWAMEEGVKAGLQVVGEIEGTPRALDFTATRRLEHFSQAARTGCMLVRVGAGTATHGSSGARRRWRVAAHPSEPDPFDPRAPGRPRWCLELTRARDRAPGRWIVEPGCDGGSDEGLPGEEPSAPHRLRVVPALALGDVPAGEAARAGGDGAHVVAFRDAGAGRLS